MPAMVRRAAGAGRRGRHLVRVGLELDDQVVQVHGRHRIPRDDQHRTTAEQRHRREIVQQVI
jgi:hypothetical protein